MLVADIFTHLVAVNFRAQANDRKGPGGEARIVLRVRGALKRQTEVEAVIDTGFSGWLTLPKPTISWLGLTCVGPGRALLGDGSVAVFNVFETQVIWNRKLMRLFVDESPSTPLVGMSLLSGCELKIDIRPGGKVSIKPLAVR